MSPPSPPVPFNLSRTFALTSLGLIVVMACGLGWLMSQVLTSRMLQREGEVSMDFVQNLLLTDGSAGFLANPDDADLKARFLNSMAHVASMREPVRANAYRADGTVVWSTDVTLIGRRYPVNDELDDALQGRLVVHSGRTDVGQPDKAEHVGLDRYASYFVESYIPILDKRDGRIMGVMELYKIPVQLNAAIRDALWQLWLACAASAAALFGSLYWLVARADRVMRNQQHRLTEAQTLSTAVELAGAVAHNLRNPLASIRVSAEMMQLGDLPDSERTEHAGDITAAVDRADRWITELVRVSQAPQLQPELVRPAQVLRACLQELQPEMTRRGVQWTMPEGEAPGVRAHTAMLRQILVSIIANAIDAMPSGGNLVVTWAPVGHMLTVQLRDTGVGIDEKARAALFRPFFSTKSGGLGIGLALVKRMVEHWQGTIALEPVPAGGTCVVLTLPLAAPFDTES